MDFSVITDTEHQEYRKFFSVLSRELLSTDRPKVLHHYTTGQNLIDIVNSSSLWCTQIGCLNDEQELSHGLKLLRSELEVRFQSANDAAKLIFRKLQERLDDQHVAQTHIYVACFSDIDDDLSQWRAYGGQGGYSIGFSVDGLLESLGGVSGVTFAPAIYDEILKLQFIKRAVGQIERFYMEAGERRSATDRDKWEAQFIEGWFLNLCFVICRFKDPRFSSEREWRLVVNSYTQPHQSWLGKFTYSKMMFRRHIALQYAGKLPIACIRVGPTQYPDHGRLGVKQMMQSYGYDLKSKDVLNSTIPLRILI